MEEGKRELHFTYLDTVGRPVVVAHKTNLVEQHIQDFEVKADCGCIIIVIFTLCMREQIASLCVIYFCACCRNIGDKPVKFQIHMMYLCRDLCKYLMGII